MSNVVKFRTREEWEDEKRAKRRDDLDDELLELEKRFSYYLDERDKDDDKGQ